MTGDVSNDQFVVWRQKHLVERRQHAEKSTTTVCFLLQRFTNGTFLAEVLPAAVLTGCGTQSDS